MKMMTNHNSVTRRALTCGLVVATAAIAVSSASAGDPRVFINGLRNTPSDYLKDTNLTGVLAPQRDVDGVVIGWDVDITGEHFGTNVNYSGQITGGAFDPELPGLAWLDDDAELLPGFEDAFIPVTTDADALQYLDFTEATIDAPLGGSSWPAWLMSRGVRPILTTPDGIGIVPGGATPVGPGQPNPLPQTGPDDDAPMNAAEAFVSRVKVHDLAGAGVLSDGEAIMLLTIEYGLDKQAAQAFIAGEMSGDEIRRAFDDAAIGKALDHLGVDSESATADVVRDVRRIIRMDLAPGEARDMIEARVLDDMHSLDNPVGAVKIFISDWASITNDPDHPVYDLASQRDDEITVTLTASAEVEVSVPPFVTVTVTGTAEVSGPASKYAELAEMATEFANDVASRLAEKIADQLDKLKELIDDLIDDFVEWVSGIDLFDFGWF